MGWRVRAFLALHVAGAAVALAVSAVLAWQSLHEVSWLIVAGVLASGVLVLQFPLELGVGKKRVVYVLDGAVMVIALVMLPPAWAIVTLSLPPVLIEAVNAHRPIDRRLLYISAVPLSHVLAVAFFVIATPVAADTAFLLLATVDAVVVLLAAVAATYVSLAAYHACLFGLLRIQGRPLPAGRGLLGKLLPAPAMTTASGFAGVFVVLVGSGGTLPFVTALVAACAVHLLYWQYRRLDIARMRMRLLFDFTSAVHNLRDSETVKALAASTATVLLSAKEVRVVDQPSPGMPHAAAMVADGRTAWLEAILTPSNIQLDEGEDQRMLEAVARVAGNALERIALAEDLRGEARRDPLTGVMNRAACEEELDAAIARARRDLGHFAIGYGDLDGLKPINDRWGHHVGDELLQVVAERLRTSLRAGDAVARIGGDEFLLLLHGAASEADAAAAVEHAAREVAGPTTAGGHELSVTISFGWAVWPSDGEDAHELIRRADDRMYLAKQLRAAAP